MPVVPRKSTPDLLWERPLDPGRLSPPRRRAPRGAARYPHAEHHGAVGGHGRRPVPPGPPARRSPRGRLPGVAADAAVTVVANTADDLWVHGLKVCPDLDTVMYTLGDGIDPERGWGRRDETWSVKEELAAYGVEPTWFGLGDRDIATHLVRTQMLDAGYPLSEVTAALCQRWLTPTSARRHAAADDRRPGRDPHRDRRPRGPERPPGRALPGVLGPAARRGARRDRRRRRPRRRDPGARRHRRDHRRRPGPAAAVQPGRLRRHHPRRPPGARGARRHPGAGGRPLPHRRRHPRARDGRADADLDRRRGQRRRGRPALRRPRRTAACSTAGCVDTRRRRPGRPGRRPPGSPAAPYP